MKCNMETLIGKQPESKFNASGILKPVTKIHRYITANIVAISTYQEASKIMTKFCRSRIWFSSKKKSSECSNLAQKEKCVSFIRVCEWNYLFSRISQYNEN
jgi:hypothetical protein